MEKFVIKPIVLDENYRIEPDAACWQLLYRKEGKVNLATGKPAISRDVSFHATLAQALQTYVDLNLRDCSDLQAVLDRLNELDAKIEKAVGGIKRNG